MTTQRHDFDPTPFLVEELPWAPRFSLRVRPEHRTTLAAALSLELPTTVGQRSTAAGTEVLCLGPDEWTILPQDADRRKMSGECAFA